MRRASKAAWRVAVLTAALCAGCGGGDGFGVHVTLRFDDSVADAEVARATSLFVSTSGGEEGSFPILLNRAANRVERFTYRPNLATRSVALDVVAEAIDARLAQVSFIAEGKSGQVALSAGETSEVEITLVGAGGADLGHAGDSGVDGAMPTCDPGLWPRGGLCLPLPVAYWPFEEGSGAITADASGKGSFGTLTNGPAWVAGKVGLHALSFDGVDDLVSIGDPMSGVLDFGTGSLTYALYVFETASVSAFDMPWYKGGASDAFSGYDMELGSGSWTANLTDGVSSKQVVFSTETQSEWVRLVAVVDRSAKRFRAYKNGVLVDSIDITGLGSLSSMAPAQVGRATPGGGYPFKGFIDDVIVFDRALSDAEVAALN